MRHQCVRKVCGKFYDSNDPDPYFCEECQERNKRLAAEIDSKIVRTPPPPTIEDMIGALSKKDSQGRTFIRAKDLGV